MCEGVRIPQLLRTVSRLKNSLRLPLQGNSCNPLLETRPGTSWNYGTLIKADKLYIYIYVLYMCIMISIYMHVYVQASAIAGAEGQRGWHLRPLLQASSAAREHAESLGRRAQRLGSFRAVFEAIFMPASPRFSGFSRCFGCFSMAFHGSFHRF